MDKPIDRIVSDLVRETASWDSIEIRMTVKQVHQAYGPKISAGSGTTTEHYIETSSLRRFYKAVQIEPPPDLVVWLGYSDGKRCASVAFHRPPRQAEQQQITITKTFLHEQVFGFVDRPKPIQYQHVGLIPLREAILKAVPSGTSKVANRDCQIFIFKNVPGQRSSQDLVYHLDSATSLPLKIEGFADEAHYRSAQPSSVWQAESLDEVQGFHVPLHSRYATYRYDGGAAIESLTNRYTIDEVKFNQDTSTMAFWPTYDKGVFINDLIEKKSYYNTPDKKAPQELVAAQTKVPQRAPGLPPIVASELGGGFPWLPTAGLVLGLLLLAAGVGLWIKRR